MEIIRKYVVLFAVALITIAGTFLFFYRLYNKDVKALTDFIASYKKFDKAISDFSIPVLVSNPDAARTLDQFNKIYSRIAASMQDTHRLGEKLALAKEAISLNNDLLDFLDKTDDLENKANEALMELDIASALRLSSLIRNDGQLMGTMLEIRDLSKRELENLSACKKAFWDKIDVTNKLLQKVVDDNGGLNGFINFSSQKNNQTKITSQNPDLDRWSKEFGDLHDSRTVAYARFQGLGPGPKKD